MQFGAWKKGATPARAWAHNVGHTLLGLGSDSPHSLHLSRTHLMSNPQLSPFYMGVCNAFVRVRSWQTWLVD